MVDSWGKPPEGVLSGHITALGDYDECVSVRGGGTGNLSHFRGKYCTNMLLPGESSDTGQDTNATDMAGDRDPRSISELLVSPSLLCL